MHTATCLGLVLALVSPVGQSPSVDDPLVVARSPVVWLRDRLVHDEHLLVRLDELEGEGRPRRERLPQHTPTQYSVAYMYAQPHTLTARQGRHARCTRGDPTASFRNPRRTPPARTRRPGLQSSAAPRSVPADGGQRHELTVSRRHGERCHRRRTANQKVYVATMTAPIFRSPTMGTRFRMRNQTPKVDCDSTHIG